MVAETCGADACREVASAAWMIDNGANVHSNEDQPLIEASYHGEEFA